MLVAATDPVNPFGSSLEWPESGGGRPQRKAGALVFLADSGPLFYLDGAGRSLLTWGEPAPELTAGFVQAVRARRHRILIKRINGGEVFGHPLADQLADAGMRLTPSGLR